MASTIQLAPLTPRDLAAVATIHERAWPESALTVFGRETLRRYYTWLADPAHDAALVGAWQGDKLVGFCAAGVFRGAMSGFLRANRLYLALQVATHPRLALTPLIRDRLKQALRITLRFSRVSRRTVRRSASPPAEIFSVLAIATDPTVRGAGAGRAMMLEAEERARRQGQARMVLVVHPDNARAVTFYEQLGWERLPEADGQWAGTMVKPL